MQVECFAFVRGLKGLETCGSTPNGAFRPNNWERYQSNAEMFCAEQDHGLSCLYADSGMRFCVSKIYQTGLMNSSILDISLKVGL